MDLRGGRAKKYGFKGGGQPKKYGVKGEGHQKWPLRLVVTASVIMQTTVPEGQK